MLSTKQRAVNSYKNLGHNIIDEFSMETQFFIGLNFMNYVRYKKDEI